MESVKKLQLKKHMLTAISYLIPIVCGSGFLIAIGMAMGGDSSADLTQIFTIWDVFARMGGLGLGLLPMIIATGISYSIADKPGIAPGIVIGLTANAVGAGFIGGLIGGFIAGWLCICIIKYFKVPNWAKGLMPMLIIPFVASLIGGLLMVYVIGVPITTLTTMLTDYLGSLSSSSRLLYGLIIGVLSCVDYGGPINKAVFAFTLTLQAEGIYEPITALILVNTATPIGFAAAHFIGKLFNKKIYNNVEVETLKTAFPMGIIEIVEGVMPIVLNDIVRCVVATGIGGAVGGSLCMMWGADASVPFGGLLALPTMSSGKPLMFIIALLANVVVTGLMLVLLKKKVNEEEVLEEVEEADIDLADIEIL